MNLINSILELFIKITPKEETETVDKKVIPEEFKEMVTSEENTRIYIKDLIDSVKRKKEKVKIKLLVVEPKESLSTITHKIITSTPFVPKFGCFHLALLLESNW